MKSQRWTATRAAIIVLTACSVASVTNVSHAADATAAGPLRIGVIVDMSGVYSGIGGAGGVTAVKMAAQDFGGKVLGRPVEVLSADYQNKVDVTATKVRTWYDQDNVQAVIESTDSASALALQKLGVDKRKITIFAGSATTELTGKQCSPYGVHYVYDTYSLANGTARALAKAGYKRWFFITADYAFGNSLQSQATRVVKEMGGDVVGSVKHPLSASDFASYLLQAQSSKAQVVALANAGRDTQNAIKQAAEFGLSRNGLIVAPLLIFDTDLKGMGLNTAQGLQFTTAFYWDQDDQTRAFAKKFYSATNKMPTMVQAGMYSATIHYLNAVQASGTTDSDKVMEKMRATPIRDFFTKDGRIEANGLMVHDMYLAEAKKPSESKGEWDLLKIRSVIPKAEAFESLAESNCPLLKK
ncbi:branched-chain amino acid ABC transporter periplasmic branched-chain amino acid-binding protein [Caballeronia arationis]|jgi:branched-chain amino acid transport system substrate-binding protein|uniref:Amino acid/amide ABC transporter substrate-binding protein, HAAT family n=1 Tax=Caballeronia arationis TaxID=1777142 RepID=A0A7Z7N827_9BURK|nr:ABC transporter substrate-binding protein [Caballeronia arationis]SAL03119.1 branched-chain amino acid ABC transporter periplasmic branched-chain amino acid-binding protein [Caballeronia arationis]SOE91433.1 amino acid/amide ABC transporter substrate-binding protein, HAAT family [Caballeronia arationis]